MLSSEQKKRESWLAFLLIVSCLSCFILGLFILKPKSSSDKKEQASQLVDSLMSDKVNIIALEGVIYDTTLSKSPFKTLLNSAYVREELKSALEDKHVKAVVLRMNSPGGTVAASQEIYQLVRKLVKANKPVIVSMGDVCASGCYYIASAASEIVSNKGTLTGSIGVISQGINYEGLMEKLGLKDQTFKSGKYKDLGSGQRVLTEEERVILQNLLDDSYDQFLSDIIASRSITREELEDKAQGLVYTGRQALEAGLVDKLGSLDDTKTELRALLAAQGYDKAGSIKFVETWSKAKLSSLDDLFDIGLSSSFSGFLEKTGLDKFLGVSLNTSEANTWDSKFKIMWLMQ